MARKQLKVGDVLTDTLTRQNGTVIPGQCAIVTEIYTRDNIMKLFDLLIEKGWVNTAFLGRVVKTILVNESVYAMVVIGDKKHIIRALKTMDKNHMVCQL